MTSRILPPEEWPKLAGTEAEGLWPHLHPARTSVVVIEENERLLACHVLSWLLHAECLWTVPDRRSAVTMRRLWRAVQHEAFTHWGVHAVITNAVDDRVRTLLAYVGAARMPGDAYIVPVKE